MDTWVWVIIVIAGVAVAGVAGYCIGNYLRKHFAEAKIGSAEAEAERIVTEAGQKAESLKKEALIDAKEEIMQQRKDFENEMKERRAEISRQENRVNKKEETLDKKSEAYDRKSEVLDRKIKENETLREQIQEVLDQHQAKLEEISGITAEEAKEELISRVESQVMSLHSVWMHWKRSTRKKRTPRRARSLHLPFSAVLPIMLRKPPFLPWRCPARR